MLLTHPDGPSGELLSDLAPFATAQVPRDGKPTVYLCRDFACELPKHDVEHVPSTLRATSQRWFAHLATGGGTQTRTGE